MRARKRELVPRCKRSYAIGRDEYAWRLDELFGMTESPDELSGWASEVLRTTHPRMIELARGIAPERDLSTLADVGVLVRDLRAEKPKSSEQVLRLYELASARTTGWCLYKELFCLPPEFRLAIVAAPPGMAVATNLPPQLRNARSRGAIAVDTKVVEEHTCVDVLWITAHEGVPGHYLQWLIWQPLFGDAPAPVRFLQVADDVNYVSGYWGTMLNIEGWALYAEELMRQSAAYSPEEELVSLTGLARRASRVVLDTGLHTRGLGTDAAAQFLIDNAFMSPPDAAAEVFRYTRLPTQAITYLVGCKQIQDLRTAYFEHAPQGATERDWHQWFLSFGPVPASRIRAMLLDGKVNVSSPERR